MRGPGVEAIDQVEARLSTDRALQLIALLPPDQAEAVTLRVIACLDVPDVAEIMGRTSGHVRVLTHRGLKKLATHLSTPAGQDVTS